jgi:hypothetical protein
MRTTSLAIITALAVALAGCAAKDIGSFLQAGAETPAAAEGKPDAAKAEAARADAAAKEAAAKDAICKWAASAGVPELAAVKTDAATTKRRIAGLIAAHEVTCPKASPPNPAPQPTAAAKKS